MQLDLAVKRGIHFEIPYAQLIVGLLQMQLNCFWILGIYRPLCVSPVGSSGIRKEIMSSTSNLLTYLKGRNLILARCVVFCVLYFEVAVQLFARCACGVV